MGQEKAQGLIARIWAAAVLAAFGILAAWLAFGNRGIPMEAALGCLALALFATAVLAVRPVAWAFPAFRAAAVFLLGCGTGLAVSESIRAADGFDPALAVSVPLFAWLIALSAAIAPVGERRRQAGKLTMVAALCALCWPLAESGGFLSWAALLLMPFAGIPLAMRWPESCG